MKSALQPIKQLLSDKKIAKRIAVSKKSAWPFNYYTNPTFELV
ncbi:hypothetical protein WJR50_11505 [Catalinimonas sp. 4WD22]